MKPNNSFSNVLGMTVIIITFGVEMVIYFNSSKDASNLAIQIISSCIALQGIVAGYFFVSSKGSATKDATIASMAQNQLQPQVTIANADKVTSTTKADTVTVNTKTTNVVEDTNKIQWLGDLATEPVNPVNNQAYFDTDKQKGYIYNGIYWKELSVDDMESIKANL